MSGNGESIPHGPVTLNAFGFTFPFQPGTGGGCVHSGPFANMSVNLGPVAFEPAVANKYDYNPRCLKRDLNLAYADGTRPTNVTSLFNTCSHISCFNPLLEGGVHAAGHNTWLGDPGIDIYSSPGDPVFYLHHAQVDRLWTIWQGLNPGVRTTQVSGTSSIFNGEWFRIRSSENRC